MHHIFYTDWTAIEVGPLMEDLLKKVPGSLHERALRYKFKEPAINFMLGRLLLMKGMHQAGLDHQAIHRIHYSKIGKPLHEDLHFNISHSGNLVACAVSTKANMGIDVEHQKDIELDTFTRWFLPEEWDSIYGAQNPLTRFFFFWRRKESVLKALDRNLDYLGEVNLMDGKSDIFYYQNQKLYLKEIDLGDNRKLAICCETEKEFEICEVRV